MISVGVFLQNHLPILNAHGDAISSINLCLYFCIYFPLFVGQDDFMVFNSHDLFLFTFRLAHTLSFNCGDYPAIVATAQVIVAFLAAPA